MGLTSACVAMSEALQRGSSSDKSQLEELRLRCKWASSRMERPGKNEITGEMIKGGGYRVV